MSKPSDVADFNIRISTRLRDRLDELGRGSRRSRNTVIELLLEDAVAREPDKVVGVVEVA